MGGHLSDVVDRQRASLREATLTPEKVSPAKHQVGSNAVGVILTGMGADGARGLLAMKNAGSHTLARDERSCVVYGMPREAVRLGAADEVVSLSAMAGKAVNAPSKEARAATA